VYCLINAPLLLIYVIDTISIVPLVSVLFYSSNFGTEFQISYSHISATFKVATAGLATYSGFYSPFGDKRQLELERARVAMNTVYNSRDTKMIENVS
jgi:hypothetical protein